MDFQPILQGLGYGAAYTLTGLAVLALGYWVLDVLTPGHLGTQLTHNDSEASASAGIVGGAWHLAQGMIIFTAIWTNATSGFGQAWLATVSFSIAGVILLALTFFVLDLLTPGKLGDIIVAPGRAAPLSFVTAGSILAVGAIVCASIA